jgi:hypothetical protein
MANYWIALADEYLVRQHAILADLLNVRNENGPMPGGPIQLALPGLPEDDA